MGGGAGAHFTFYEITNKRSVYGSPGVLKCSFIRGKCSPTHTDDTFYISVARNKKQYFPDVVGSKEGFYPMLPPPEHDGDDGAATAVNKTPICPRVAASSWLLAVAIISSCPDSGHLPGDRDMGGVTSGALNSHNINMIST